jgi:peptidyl-tRNA hydrolase, PTH1 family
MRLIVGLGNKDRCYSNTRHNVGFIVLDRICETNSFSWHDNKTLSSVVAKGVLGEKNLLFLKPNTYMNLSGFALQAACDYYKIKPEEVLVIHDDIDLKFCELKVKFAGGSGGHNGLKSIDQNIGNLYYRLRIGVDRPSNQLVSVADYVLSDFTKEELKNIKNTAEIIEKHFHLLVNYKLEDFRRELAGNKV